MKELENVGNPKTGWKYTTKCLDDAIFGPLSKTQRTIERFPMSNEVETIIDTYTDLIDENTPIR